MLASTNRVLCCAVLLGAWSLSANSAEAQGEYEEPWYLTLDLGATGPLNDGATDLFNLGGDAGLGVYRSLFPEFAVGARARVGVLSDGGTLPQLLPAEDPGLLDYGYVGTAVRVRPFARMLERHTGELRRATGPYLETGPGVALLDGDAVFAYEGAIGWNFGLGPVAIGPQFRFTHFVETHGRFGDNQITTWTGAIELAFLDEARAPYVEPAAAPERVAEIDDGDQCPNQAETWNGYQDADGCPDRGVGRFTNDALVVNERVFFDFDSAALRPTGAEQLDMVVAQYRRNGERYDHLLVIGHADARGADDYNELLSQKRGQQVLIYLKDHGIPGTAIRVDARGETDPAVANAETELDHQVNRNVEFRIEWRVGMRPEGVEPERSQTMPEYVDAAPAHVQQREARLARREQQRRDRAIARREQPSAPVAALGEGRGVAADERQASLEPNR